MPAGKVEYEDISILNNSESGGTSNEDFVMKSEQQPLVYLKLNNFLHSLNMDSGKTNKSPESIESR